MKKKHTHTHTQKHSPTCEVGARLWRRTKQKRREKQVRMTSNNL